jgi:transposase-like protein
MNKTKNEKNASVTATVESKRYEEAFKREAVEHWLRSGKSGTQIAQEMGISYPGLKEWKRRSGGEAAPQRSDLEAENRARRAELARVREQRDILKKTLGILSEVPRPATSASKP